MSMRIWENLPSKYRAAEDPDTPITLWRGDKVGCILTSIECMLDTTDAEEVVYRSFTTPPKLRNLVNRHGNHNLNSPFISLTRDIRVAQLFATGPNETIYEVILPAAKLIADPVGPKAPPDSYGIECELYAIGRIEPEDITAVKINNGDASASELLYIRDGEQHIHDQFSLMADRNNPQQQPNPIGQWDRSRSWVE